MKHRRLSRRDLLRLGAGATLGAGLSAAAPALTHGVTSGDVVPAVARGVAIRSLDTGQRQVALTYDDLWYGYHALRIGRAWAKLDVRVTFFPTGLAVQNHLARSHEDLANLYPRLRDMGHEFGTHLFTHGNLREYSLPELVERELEPALQVMRRALGNDFMPLAIRPPYGIMTQALKDLSRQYDIPLVLWNLDSGDTLCGGGKIENSAECSEEIVATLEQYLVPGSIVLHHTIKASYLAIEPTAELLDERNLQAAPLSEMLNAAG